MSARDPRRIQRALVCMLFDPAYADRLRAHAGDGPGPDGLGADELALLRAVDPRALATDPMRRPRAVTALLEEYPVSGALLGVAAVDRFFSDDAFRRCVYAGEGGSMALAFGTWLKDQALGVGRIEAAIADARRRLIAGPRLLAEARALARARGEEALVCAPGIAPLLVPAGTLAWYQRARARLGPDPLAALAALRRPWPQRPPRSGEEALIAQAGADGDVSLGTASPALVHLLAAALAPRPRGGLAARAVELGCDADEAAGLLDDLRGDGLLAP